MEPVVIPLQPRGFGTTLRRDAWWAQPLLTFLVLGAFVVYATWAAFQGAHYEYGPYLSPFYSPLLFGEGPHSWFGPWARPGWWPGALPFSAALLILWAPGGFRFTCYYYRGAYYKAFWADPPSCAVGEPRKGYRRRERPFRSSSRTCTATSCISRCCFLIVLWRDVWEAMWFPTAGGGTHVRHRRRHARARREQRAADRLYARLPFAPASRRRRPRSVLRPSGARRRSTTPRAAFNCRHNAMGVGQSLRCRAG